MPGLAGLSAVLASFAAGLLASVLSALLIAYWLGRRIALPIGLLARAARHLGTGRPANVVDSTIEEVFTLARAFREADAAINERLCVPSTEGASVVSAFSAPPR